MTFNPDVIFLDLLSPSIHNNKNPSQNPCFLLMFFPKKNCVFFSSGAQKILILQSLIQTQFEEMVSKASMFAACVCALWLCIVYVFHFKIKCYPPIFSFWDIICDNLISEIFGNNRVLGWQSKTAVFLKKRVFIFDTLCRTIQITCFFLSPFWSEPGLGFWRPRSPSWKAPTKRLSPASRNWRPSVRWILWSLQWW